MRTSLRRLLYTPRPQGRRRVSEVTRRILQVSARKVRCSGCQALKTEDWGYECNIVQCLRGKGLGFCYQCDEYGNGGCEKSVRAGGTFSFFNVRPFLTVLGQAGATVIAFSFHSTNRQRFSTFWALVLFFTFFQQCFGFAVLDSLQACLYVFFVFQVPRRQFSKLLVVSSHWRASFRFVSAAGIFQTNSFPVYGFTVRERRNRCS